MAENETMIERREGVCGGRPVIAGTSVSVQSVAIWSEAYGLTPEQIAENYGHLSVEQVQAALDYYHDHREEIDGYIAASLAEAEDFAHG